MGILSAPLSGLLDAWGELLLALHGINGYGGDTAEIYEWVLRSDAPALRFHAQKRGEPLPADQRAADALLELAQHFAKEFGCAVYIGEELVATHRGTPVSARIPANGHRYHVRVEASK